jgi:hypothetical protein
MNILQSILSSDSDGLKKQIDALKAIKSTPSKKMIAVLEAALSLKEQLEFNDADEKNRLLYAVLAHPWLATEKMKRKLKQWNNVKQTITEENIRSIVSVIVTDMDDERILEESCMLGVQNAIKKILGIKRLHTNTLYDILWESNPYDKELHRDHVYFCAKLRDLEYRWQKDTSEYNKIKYFVKNFRMYDTRMTGPKVVWKIDLPAWKKNMPVQDKEVKLAETTDPLSIVWENKTSITFLQCYNLDTIEKVQEAYKDGRTIPARIMNITSKLVFLTIGQENLWWWNTRLFNLAIPLAAFKNKKPNVGDIHAVKVARVAVHNDKPWEWFMQGYLETGNISWVDKPHVDRGTFADLMPEEIMNMYEKDT